MAVPDFSAASDNLFKTVPSNDVVTRRIARYALEHGIKRVAVGTRA